MIDKFPFISVCTKSPSIKVAANLQVVPTLPLSQGDIMCRGKPVRIVTNGRSRQKEKGKLNLSICHIFFYHMILPFIKPFHKFSNKTHVT